MKNIKPNSKTAFRRLKSALSNKRNKVKAISRPFIIFVQKNGQRVPVIGGIFPTQRDVDNTLLDLFAGAAIHVRGIRR